MTPALLSHMAGLAIMIARGWMMRGMPPAMPRGARLGLSIAMIGLGAALLLARQAALGITLGALGVGLWPRGGPGPRRSSVRSAVLEMNLDHASGAMDGRVLKGEFAGRILSEMSLEELLRLAASLDEADAETPRLLSTYLDRAHPGWRDEESTGTAHDAGPSARTEPMSRDEACRILGLEPGADAAAIRAAHRRLMKRVHPDLGGSAALAAQINAAKERLL
jgi:hypothetical protein